MKFEIDLKQLVTAKDKAKAAQAEQAAAEREKAVATLAETDWFVTRFAETGKAIPDGVKAARAASRKAITEDTVL